MAEAYKSWMVSDELWEAVKDVKLPGDTLDSMVVLRPEPSEEAP